MKNALRFAAAALALALLPAARAESFNITNQVATGVSYVSAPTNSVGTNGIGYCTGGAINTASYEQLGFWFSCAGASSANQTLTIGLCRAGTDGPPRTTDWETSPQWSLTLTTSGTNQVVWCTNLDACVVGPANWLGIYSITNSGNGLVTNCSAWVVKRLFRFATHSSEGRGNRPRRRVLAGLPPPGPIECGARGATINHQLTMAWKTVTVEDVLGEFTVEEQAALKGIQGAGDALPLILARVVNAVRGAIRAGGYRLGAEGTTPDQLDLEIVAMARWRWLTAFSQLQRLQTRDRRDAHDEALAKLDRIAQQRIAIEPPEEPKKGGVGRAGVPSPKSGQWNSENKLLNRTHPVPTPEAQWPVPEKSLPPWANPQIPE
ncbi:MAG: hypothetical protein ACLQVX_19580 [Limisphaerales bacterium]